MILLTSTSDLIQVVTSGTADVDVQASYVDVSGSTVTPARTNTAIASAATTTVVASPAASTQRNLKYLNLRNKHAATANTVTVKHTDGTTAVELVKLSLPAGYTLHYNDVEGWVLIDAAGGRIETPLTGRYIQTTKVTSASANFTTSALTNTIVVRGVGAGAGGAGCTSVAAAASAGGGGGAGGYAEKTFVVAPNTAYAYTCGAAGTGASGAAGNNGADSTFVVGATTVTAKGGTGAVVATALTTLSAYKGGAGGTVSTNGDLNGAGQPGANGIVVVVATPVGASGGGGSGPFGAGGDPIAAVGTGNAAKGNGAGGGGAMTGASTVRTGGDGTAGCWYIDEYT